MMMCSFLILAIVPDQADWSLTPRSCILQDRAEFRRALGSAIVSELALDKCEVRVLFDDLRVRGRDVKAPFAEEDALVPFTVLRSIKRTRRR